MKLRYNRSYYIQAGLGWVFFLWILFAIGAGVYSCQDSVRKINEIWEVRK